MNRIAMMLSAILLATAGYAQTDSTGKVTDSTRKNSPDTIRVGNFVIVKKNKNAAATDNDNYNRDHSFSISFGSNKESNDNSKRRRSIVSTNWLIFDLGFANWRDKTNYGAADVISNPYLNKGTGADFSKSDFNLRNVKSSNVNIWLFMQKLNISKHVLNLKYGLGYEMYNYRYETAISYSNSPASIYRDTLSFKKNKLFAGYITVPLMININPSPYRHRGFSFSGGVSAGYLVGAHTKQISNERGKQKTHGELGLNNWRLAYVAEIGLGPVRLYGSYSINPLHQEALKQYPYVVGIRFSNW